MYYYTKFHTPISSGSSLTTIKRKDKYWLLATAKCFCCMLIDWLVDYDNDSVSRVTCFGNKPPDVSEPYVTNKETITVPQNLK
jgi:hypothetical protein